MRTDAQLKTYEYIKNRCLYDRLPEDQWVAEGVIRVNVCALQRAIRYKPDFFVSEKTGRQDACTPSAADQLSIEYGPDDWRIIDRWDPQQARADGRIWKVPGDILLPYLWEEEDVKRYLAHWNYVVSYRERRERMKCGSKDPAAEEAAASLMTCELPPGGGSQDRLADGQASWEKAAWEAILAGVSSGALMEPLMGSSPGSSTGTSPDDPVEVMTRAGRWFGVYRSGEQLYICEAKHMAPGCPVTFDRKIRPKEVAALLPLYEKWAAASDEEEIRGQARQISASYEYIFAMIRQYAIR